MCRFMKGLYIRERREAVERERERRKWKRGRGSDREEVQWHL